MPPFMFLPLSHTSPPCPLFSQPFPFQVRNEEPLKHSYFIARHAFPFSLHAPHLYHLCTAKLKSVLLLFFLLVLKTFHPQHDGLFFPHSPPLYPPQIKIPSTEPPVPLRFFSLLSATQRSPPVRWRRSHLLLYPLLCPSGRLLSKRRRWSWSWWCCKRG